MSLLGAAEFGLNIAPLIVEIGWKNGRCEQTQPVCPSSNAKQDCTVLVI